MSRDLIKERFFLNISLSKSYPDIYFVRNSILKALKLNIPKFHGTLLDVGCGIMPYRELILESNTKVINYIGLDFENSLDWEYALGKPDLFWKGDIIPMDDETVDCIMATELLEHCPQPEAVMKEMLRVLKPGGMVFLTVPFLWNLHLVPYDEYRYTPFSLNRHLSSAGFKNIELNALGGVDASLAQMLGIWLQRKTLNRVMRVALSVLILPVMKLLIKQDSKVAKKSEFSDGTMITGLYGTAYK